MCDAAGRTTLASVVDHIVERHHGGTDELTNLQPLCPACHELKSLQSRGYKPRIAFDRHGRPVDPDDPWNVARRSPADAEL